MTTDTLQSIAIIVLGVTAILNGISIIALWRSR